MAEDYGPRLPGFEWAHREAADALQGLDWVDATIAPRARPFRQGEEEEGERRFRHMPYSAFLPAPMVEASQHAQSKGRATGLEAMQLMFARLEWLISTRDLIWSPVSPRPRILGSLVEAFGVDPELHVGNQEYLARLTALLPGWHPRRGTVESACVLLRNTGRAEQGERITVLGDEGAREALADEVFACRNLRWWTARQQQDAQPRYRIVDGFLRFQPPLDAVFGLRKEDVLIDWTPGRKLPRELMRLLPPWTVIRVAVETESNP